MPGVYEKKELVIVAEDNPGTLAKVTAPIAESGINLNAYVGYAENGKAYFRCITNDNDKAMSVLKNAGFECSETSVVVVETSNEIGSMYKAAENLAQANVNLTYCYATNGPEGNTTWIVFGTDEIGKALNAIS